MADKHTELVKKYFTDAGFSHLGLVVEDIERSVENYCALLGEERPFMKQTLSVEESKTMFLGQLTEARIRQTFFTIGGLRVELMQPDHHPSTWRECLDESGRDCIHHAAYQVKSIAECENILGELGMRTVQTGSYKGGRYAYVDSRKQLGMLLELLEAI